MSVQLVSHRDDVLRDVIAERISQDAKWGDQSHLKDSVWGMILAEEVGESAQAVLHDKFGGAHAGTLREELVQVAAVAIAWLEAIHQRGVNP